MRAQTAGGVVKVKATKSALMEQFDSLDALIASLPEGHQRRNCAEALRDCRASWLTLARRIAETVREREWCAWGFATMDEWLQHDMGMTGAAGRRLVAAYDYMRHVHPEALEAAKALPAPEVVAKLARIVDASARREADAAIFAAPLDAEVAKGALAKAAPKKPKAAPADAKDADEPDAHAPIASLNDAERRVHQADAEIERCIAYYHKSDDALANVFLARARRALERRRLQLTQPRKDMSRVPLDFEDTQDAGASAGQALDEVDDAICYLREEADQGIAVAAAGLARLAAILQSLREMAIEAMKDGDSAFDRAVEALNYHYQDAIASAKDADGEPALDQINELRTWLAARAETLDEAIKRLKAKGAKEKPRAKGKATKEKKPCDSVKQ